jgi:hypothetical protein
VTIPLFGIDRPVIGMVHLPALPGSPYATSMTRRELLAAAQRDLGALLDAGFDAISISNEADRPYVTTMPPETIALFTWLATELTRDLEIPFGCGALIDPFASLAIARAIGAHFIRVSYSVEAGAFGLMVQTPGAILRHRRAIGADDVGIVANYTAHFGTSLDSRPIDEVARTYAALAPPDAIQIHGAGAGVPPPRELIEGVKAAVPDVPVLVASGVAADAVGDALAIADGIIVGTWLKVDGHIYNPIDPERARRFMEAVRGARSR